MLYNKFPSYDKTFDGTTQPRTAKHGFKTCCSAANCTNNKRRSPDLSFFRFPLDPERSKQWVILANRADLLPKDAPYLHRNCKLCALHFEDSMFANDLRNRLHYNAKPTLFDGTDKERKSLRKFKRRRYAKYITGEEGQPMQEEQSLPDHELSKKEKPREGDDLRQCSHSMTLDHAYALKEKSPSTISPLYMASFNNENIKTPRHDAEPAESVRVLTSTSSQTVAKILPPIPPTVIQIAKVCQCSDVRDCLKVSESTQTMHFSGLSKKTQTSKLLSKEHQIHRKQVRTVRRLKKTIENLRERNAKLVSKIEEEKESNSVALERILQDMSPSLKRFIILQWKLARYKKGGRKYNTAMKSFALPLYDASHRAYRLLSQMFFLPSKKCLQRWKFRCKQTPACGTKSQCLLNREPKDSEN